MREEIRAAGALLQTGSWGVLTKGLLPGGGGGLLRFEGLGAFVDALSVEAGNSASIYTISAENFPLKMSIYRSGKRSVSAMRMDGHTDVVILCNNSLCTMMPSQRCCLRSFQGVGQSRSPFCRLVEGSTGKTGSRRYR